MNNVLYVGLSRQMTLQREMDVIANNIANSDTAGFKLESLKVDTDTENPKAFQSGAAVAAPISFVLDSGVDRDFNQGAMRTTGAPLDMAIQGDGFFSVQTANGLRYTRDGRFSLDGTGQIVDLHGDAVQGAGGPIVLDPLKGEPSIARDGTISQTDKLGVTTLAGRISVVRFDNRNVLAKAGNTQFANTSNAAPLPANNSQIVQGMLENSNVEPIVQMTRLIAVSRAYEQIANLMSQTGDSSDQSIQRLGRVTN